MVKTSNKFALWLTIGRLISMSIVFVMPLAMTRFLSQADYGVFSQFFTLYSTILVIAALGTHSNIFYFYPTGSNTEKNQCITNTFFALLLLGIATFLFLNIPWIKTALFGEGELSTYKNYAILAIALAVPMNIVGPLCTVREDKIGAIVIPGSVALLRVIVVIAIAAVFNNLKTIFLSLVFFQLFILLFTVVYSLKGTKIQFNVELFKKQIAYSLPFGVTVGLQLFSNYFDKIVSIHYLTATEYAIYSVAFLSIPGINQIYDSLCQVNIINMTKCYQSGEKQRVLPLYKEFVIKTLSFSVPIILIVSLFAEEIISFLYPQSYSQAAIYFRIYSLTFLIGMIGAGTILRAVNKTHLSLKAFLISCLFGLPLSVYLVSNYGINGAISSAVINIFLPRILQFIFEMNILKSNFQHYLPWRKLLIVFFAATFIIIPFCIIKSIYQLNIVVCVILSILYIIACYSIFIKKNVFIVETDVIKEYTIKLKKHFSKSTQNE